MSILSRHLPVLNSPLRVAILLAVADGPITWPKLLAATGKTRSNLASPVRLLAVAGLIQAKRSHPVTYSITESGAKIANLLKD